MEMRSNNLWGDKIDQLKLGNESKNSIKSQGKIYFSNELGCK